MLANRTAPTGNAFSGPIYVDTGPPFDALQSVRRVPTSIGNGQLTFTDANNGTFAYTVNGVAQIKSLTRFDVGTGPQPACVLHGAHARFRGRHELSGTVVGRQTAAESGWGINFAHQGNAIFATWYTYDVNGAPLWLSVLATSSGAGYSGTLYRTAGPTFSNYDSSQWAATAVGTATIAFTDGNHASFGYTTNGQGGLPAATQSKSITRFAFATTGGTVCR